MTNTEGTNPPKRITKVFHVKNNFFRGVLSGGGEVTLRRDPIRKELCQAGFHVVASGENVPWMTPLDRAGLALSTNDDSWRTRTI